MVLPNPTSSDRVILATSCVASALAGMYLMWWMHHYDESQLFLFVGLTHAITLAGALWYARISAIRAALCLIVCALFPWWGVFVGMLGMLTFSGITCSLAWGVILAYTFKAPLAPVLMTAIGSIPTAYLLVTVAPNGVVPEWFFPGEVAFWQATASPDVAWLGVRCRSKRLSIGEALCEVCRYPREGLTPGTPCPECGSPPEPERHA